MAQILLVAMPLTGCKSMGSRVADYAHPERNTGATFLWTIGESNDAYNLQKHVSNQSLDKDLNPLSDRYVETYYGFEAMLGPVSVPYYRPTSVDVDISYEATPRLYVDIFKRKWLPIEGELRVELINKAYPNKKIVRKISLGKDGINNHSTNFRARADEAGWKDFKEVTLKVIGVNHRFRIKSVQMKVQSEDLDVDVKAVDQYPTPPEASQGSPGVTTLDLSNFWSCEKDEYLTHSCGFKDEEGKRHYGLTLFRDPRSTDSDPVAGQKSFASQTDSEKHRDIDIERVFYITLPCLINGNEEVPQWSESPIEVFHGTTVQKLMFQDHPHEFTLSGNTDVQLRADPVTLNTLTFSNRSDCNALKVKYTERPSAKAIELWEAQIRLLKERFENRAMLVGINNAIESLLQIEKTQEASDEAAEVAQEASDEAAEEAQEASDEAAEGAQETSDEAAQDKSEASKAADQDQIVQAIKAIRYDLNKYCERPETIKDETSPICKAVDDLNNTETTARKAAELTSGIRGILRTINANPNDVVVEAERLLETIQYWHNHMAQVLVHNKALADEQLQKLEKVKCVQSVLGNQANSLEDFGSPAPSGFGAECPEENQ